MRKERRSSICQEEMEQGPEAKVPEQEEAWAEAAGKVRAEAVKAAGEVRLRVLEAAAFVPAVVKK
ncbi:MAG: hypothetical protein JW793_06475 [Acidobacteria bacterium]|nr:hypothetical protein [Acidobacteriota bacterium]